MKISLYLLDSQKLQKVRPIIFAGLLAALLLILSFWLFDLSANTSQAAPASGGGTIDVGSVTKTRFNEEWTLDGAEMITTRIKLLSPLNFGPTGTVPYPIVISDTAATSDSVNLGMLNNFDIFFIGYLYDLHQNAFTNAELAAMESWVQSGGRMIITCDEQDYDAVCAYFGYPSLYGSVSPITPTAAGVAHPIFDGPFGVVTSVTLEGDYGYFTTTIGAEVLAEDASGLPIVIQKTVDVGCGVVILMSDVDLITDYGGITPGETIVSNKDRFLGNLFAYMGLVTTSCTQFIPAMFSVGP